MPALATVGTGWQYDTPPNSGAFQNGRDVTGFAITYDAASGRYAVDAPVAGSGTLMQVSALETYPYPATIRADPANKSTNAYGPALSIAQAGQPQSKYSYVSFVDLYAQAPIQSGLATLAYGFFAVAQPTKAGDVPTTGTASYTGELNGAFERDAFGSWITGIAHFDFDFAKAILSGNLTASINCLMGCTSPRATYTFTNTSFLHGATTFSGQLQTPGAPSLGTFSGLFAGPKAAELVSRFELPFYSNQTQSWLTTRGVIAAKRD